MSASCAVWVLTDPRAGTAAQALGIAERLGVPFRTVPLEWGPLARLPIPWPSLAGLTRASRRGLRVAALEGPWARMAALGPGVIPRVVPDWPGLVISAGRRAGPVSRWLRRRGARTVHCMRPGAGAEDFDLLVVGRHDAPAPAPNLLAITGATHRMSPLTLARAAEAWPGLMELPRPRVAVLLGGAIRGEGMAPAAALSVVEAVLPYAASVLLTTSRRTGEAAGEAVEARLLEVPGMVHRWGAEGENPFPGFLAAADAIVVTADSVSMLSEALATPVPVFVAGGLPEAPRHRALVEGLLAAGLAAPLEAFPAAPPRAVLDEGGRVAAAVRSRLMDRVEG